jgi:hypothetical protein
MFCPTGKQLSFFHIHMQPTERRDSEPGTQKKIWPRMGPSQFSTIAQKSGIDIKDS